MNYEKVMKYLRSRIEELERRIKELSEELEVLKAIASELSKGRAEAQRVREEGAEGQPEGVKVIYYESDVIANEIPTTDGVRVVLRGGLRVDDELVESFLMKLLDELKDRGDLADYRVKESNSYLTEVVLVNPTQLALKQVETAIRYVWSRSVSKQSQQESNR
jgi:polyhydroxyalkanoate synthesis regulator phasin